MIKIVNIIDLMGQKFGRLIVIRRDCKNKYNHVMWLCQCDCGKKIITTTSNLKNGNTNSCGCLFREGNNTKHGHTKNKKESWTHISWSSMIRRCNDVNYKRYKDYGGRGIAVCQEWLEFKNFLKDMGERPLGYTIDRKNNDNGYCKKNCRWATSKQQQRNRQNNKSITHDNKTQLLVEWSEETGISYNTLYARIYRLGWSVKKALTTFIGITK